MGWKTFGICDLCGSHIDIEKGWADVTVAGTGDVYLPLDTTDGKAQRRLICPGCAAMLFPLLKVGDKK